MKGLESAQMIRPGYAIEYDFVQPTELYPSLETKRAGGCSLPARSTARRAMRKLQLRACGRESMQH